VKDVGGSTEKLLTQFLAISGIQRKGLGPNEHFSAILTLPNRVTSLGAILTFVSTAGAPVVITVQGVPYTIQVPVQSNILVIAHPPLPKAF